ncbi:hypothetical protein JTB14_007428 [Gonioctena quinquepunctata]|nr:hypothetical protein JTB14_007428 [Gonioctena quinquepunctata]
MNIINNPSLEGGRDPKTGTRHVIPETGPTPDIISESSAHRLCCPVKLTEEEVEYRLKMEGKVEVNRLEKEELSYELDIRGITGLTTVDSMRKSLRNLLKLEKAGTSLTFPSYPFTFDEDSVSTKDEEHSKRSTFLIKLLDLKLNLLSKTRKFKRDSRNSQIPLQLSMIGQAGHSSSRASSVSSNSDDDHSSVHGRVFPNTQNNPSVSIQTIPVAKWGLNKFSGDCKMSLSAFLENVEELCISRNVTKQQLFASASDIFTGQAYCGIDL